ncbi:hypothetical protein HDU76_006892 [Blyttiomyces sp. JEL0837]|nr:hypothetical protein HDU76_006892 [Blyttiomyces sp. JEL0837]
MLHNIATLSLFLCTLLITQVQSLPNGAPKCKINPMIIQNGHKVAASTIEYTFSNKVLTYMPGGPAIAITISGGTAFKGILTYVTGNSTKQDSALAPNGVNDHVGVFTVPAGLRPQTTTSCQANTVNNDAPKSTLTHAMPLNAQTPFTLMWTPPATNRGPVTVNAVISVGTMNTPWEVVPSITLMPAGGGAAAPGGNAAAGGVKNVPVAANPPANANAAKPAPALPVANPAPVAVAKPANAPKPAKAKAAATPVANAVDAD